MTEAGTHEGVAPTDYATVPKTGTTKAYVVCGTSNDKSLQSLLSTQIARCREAFIMFFKDNSALAVGNDSLPFKLLHS